MPSSEPGPDPAADSGPRQEVAGQVDRLGELALLIAGHLADDAGFGATRLNKALFLTDFLHYKRYGSSVSGAVYERLPRAPAPRGIVEVRERLVAQGDARLRPDRTRGGRPGLRGAAGTLPPQPARLAVGRRAGGDPLPFRLPGLGGPGAGRPGARGGAGCCPRAGRAGRRWRAGRRGRWWRGWPAAGDGPAAPGTARGYECPRPAAAVRGEEVRAGVEWALARWPEGVHRIPGTRLHEVRTEWPVPALRVWFTLGDEPRATVWAVDEVAPYADEEDGSD